MEYKDDLSRRKAITAMDHQAEERKCEKAYKSVKKTR
jgi:hypothetical protein